MSRPMKNSGVDWLGDIPADWTVGKVKQYYKIQTGFTPDTKKEEYYDDANGYDWVNISDIHDGKTITETKKKISQLYINKFSPTQIPADSLLYSFKLSVGQTAFAGKSLYSNEAIAAFIPSDRLTLPTAKAGGILASKRTAPKVASYTLSTSLNSRVPHGTFYSSS